MISKKKNILFFFLAFSLQAIGQVEINNNIELTGNANSKRQIENIGKIDSSSAISFNHKLSNKGIYFNAQIISDTIYITNQDYFLKSGYHIFIKMDDSNNDSSVILKFNNTYYDILKTDYSAVHPTQWQANEIVSFFIKDTVAFINHFTNKKCPNGFLKVNKKYCIEIDERNAMDFFDAIISCGDSNARLCNWGEYYYACQKYGSSALNAMTNNYEWVDDGANGDKQVRIVGSGDCKSVGIGNAPTQNIKFRCCVSLH